MYGYYLNKEEEKGLKTTAAARTNCKVSELVPTRGQKSFNHRAHILQDASGTLQLLSYDTIVASFDPQTKELKKLWNGYSATTQKHINSFCDYCGIKGFNKKEWENLK